MVDPTNSTYVQRSTFGVNVFSYDSQLAAPSSITALDALGTGMQQFPTANWSWVTNQEYMGGTAPVSLQKWAQILTATNNQGLFIFSYDANPTWTGGGTPQDAAQLTQYIVQNHLPINAIVIGSEVYGAWDFGANLNQDKSAAYYVHQADVIAKAIHQVDPKMLVGIDFNAGTQVSDMTWNQTVLRETAGDIQFISLHDYPLSQAVSDAQMLQQLPADIASMLSYARKEIDQSLPAGEASKVQVWVTEFNPYGQPTVQSQQAVYGAAMVESLLAWRALGASRVVLWSFDGQAHSQLPGWPVASATDPNYGLFAIVGDGMAPEIGMNDFYPSAQAIATLMQAIGNGAQLQTWIGQNMLVGQLSMSGGFKDFIINEANQPLTLNINGTDTTIPAASIQELSLRGGIETLSPYMQANYVQSPAFQYTPAPTISTQPTALYPGEIATLRGRNFGASGTGYVVLTQGTNPVVEYGAPQNAYKVLVSSWSTNKISFIVPNGYSGPGLQVGQPATLQVVTGDGVVSATNTVAVTTPNPQTASQPNPSLPSVSGVVSTGSTLTITGSNLGTEPPTWEAHSGGADQNILLIHDETTNLNYGFGGDWYGVNIVMWTQNSIAVDFGPNAPIPGDLLDVTVNLSDNGISVPISHASVTYGRASVGTPSSDRKGPLN